MGSIPFGLILTKVFLKKDIRDVGSGNIGATNVLRTGNKLIGYFTLILDVLKAVIPVLYVKLSFPELVYISSLSAFIGHVFPIWLKFKGGKGVATYVGILFSINNLSLNENDIGDFRTFLKLSPPLRTEDDRLALIKGVNNDLIDVIVSDHKPEDEEQKRLTFAQAATGASGIETLLPLALELYHNESIKLYKIIKALTCNPAKILKINKGNLSIGNEADFCILDINKPWVVKKENLISKSKNTSIEGRKLQGKITNTFVKGEELFKI